MIPTPLVEPPSTKQLKMRPMILFYFPGASSSVVLCMVAQHEYQKWAIKHCGQWFIIGFFGIFSDKDFVRLISFVFCHRQQLTYNILSSICFIAHPIICVIAHCIHPSIRSFIFQFFNVFLCAHFFTQISNNSCLLSNL